MKTPKRTCRDCLFFTAYSAADPDGRCGEGCGTYGTHTKGSQEACGFFMLSSAAKNARRKRKNRIAKYKRTISILKHRLKDTEETLRITQKITKCFIVKPDHWHHLDENGNELTRKQWRIKTKKENAACHPENAENGRQQDCVAQNAKNAKQGNLLCADAAQLTERKGN